MKVGANVFSESGKKEREHPVERTSIARRTSESAEKQRRERALTKNKERKSIQGESLRMTNLGEGLAKSIDSQRRSSTKG